MYISSSMTPNPLCLRPEMSLLELRGLRAGSTVRHFPVTDAAGRPVGMVSDRDLRSALPSTLLEPTARSEELEQLGQVRVETIMGRPPITLAREATLDDALLLFDRHRIGALSVVDHEGRLVGIITVRDVLGAYRRLFGIGLPGASQIEICDDGRPALLSRIAGALESVGVACTRLVRTEGGSTPGSGPGVVYARVQTYNLHTVHEALRAAGLRWVARTPGAPAP